MKELKSFVLIFALFITSSVMGATITIDGTYQGENIYVQNPFNSSSNTFCITEVFINDQPYAEINSSAFEIVLSQFKIGQYVEIRIEHRSNCKPRILNAEALRSKSSFEIVSIKATEDQLKFTTKNETNEEPFIAEQFRNNKWVRIASLKGQGPEGFNNYTAELNHYSGVNKYRIKQRDLGNKHRYSKVLEYKSNKAPITFYPKRVSNEIYLSESTNFEIYDSFGALVKKGIDEKINVQDLEEGVYYLNIDNRTEKFLKK